MFAAKSRKIIIILVIVLILVVVAISLAGMRKQPEIIQVFPEPGSQEVSLNTEISVLFINQAPENISLQIEPSLEIKQEVYNQSFLAIPQERLQEGVVYQVTVLFGKKDIFSWSFTTKELQESEVMEEEVEITQRLYPLIDYLPLETDTYHLTYARSMVLQVTLKAGTQEAAEAEIKTWIQSKGVDPATHEIIFTPGP